MRIFTACLGTETHTWAPLPTDTKAYEDTYLVRGGDHPEAVNMFGVPLQIWRGHADAKGWETVESLCAFATPSGLVVKRTYETYRDEILADLKNAMPVDAVMLSLHGAMVADGYDDCQDDLVHCVRGIVGPDVFIGCELDLHCHITKRFVENTNAFVIFKEYPHIDFAERAEEIWTIMERTLAGDVKPVISTFDCRMIELFHTTREPMRSFVDGMAALEGQDGVLSVSLGHGFPWANIPHVGARMVVITDDRKDHGDRLAEELGRKLWTLRDSIVPSVVEMDDAIDQALAFDAGPVVFGDAADNPGGGAAGDSTFIAHALIARGITNAAIGGIWDPVAVDICKGAGVGAKLGLRLGGKAGPWSGDPLDLQVTVKAVFDDMIADGLGNSTRRMGNTVTLEADGIEYVVHAVRTQNFHPSFFANAGIDYAARKILVVKSMQHFYSNYAAISDKVIYVSTPGVVDHNIRRLPLERAARPVWPLDDDPWASNEQRPW
jgi:microcystin degradation protein MlrC